MKQCGRATLRAAAALGGVLALSGCEQVVQWRRPEVVACQRFLRSQMNVPASFTRTYYRVTDLLADGPLIAKAVARPIAEAKAPAIRDVFIQYVGDDAFGRTVGGSAHCRFALADNRSDIYAQDMNASVDDAIRENESRVLMVSMGHQGVVAADCCLARTFDLARLKDLKRVSRGTASVARKS